MQLSGQVRSENSSNPVRNVNLYLNAVVACVVCAPVLQAMVRQLARNTTR